MPSNKYWNDRYLNDDIGWDIGEISRPIKHWLDNYKKKNKKILIPGGGSGFEAGYAYEKGFKNTYYLDFSKVAVNKFKKTFPSFPETQIISKNFFSLSDFNGFFDIIIEQTFFCAIQPSMRLRYVNKIYDLLQKNGIVIGLLFNLEFKKDTPPFGGTKKDYKLIFEPKFNVIKMEKCINSIAPRAKNELWFCLNKKDKILL